MAPASKKVLVSFIVASGGGSLWKEVEALEVDVSTAVSESGAKCLKSSDVTGIIPRAFHSTGTLDTAACGTLQNAKTASIATRDAYMFPCPKCGSAGDQVDKLSSYLSSCSAFTGRLWLDIEGSQFWLGDSASNRKWYQDLVDASRAKFKSVGIYSSYYQWENIFGSTSYVYGHDLPLWYAHYDKKQTFSDFKSFAGWTTPAKKQFIGTSSICSVSVDQNYAPGAENDVVV